jgi:hypothetical protein
VIIERRHGCAGAPRTFGGLGGHIGAPNHMDLSPVTLKGRWLTLEAIDERHAPGLFEAMRDDEVCRYLAWEPPASLDDTLALVRSQEAIARLGAVREGVLRRHMRVKGYQRDTVYFSILDAEWPAVKARLQASLARPERAPAR